MAGAVATNEGGRSGILSHLEIHGQSPEQYIASKFAHHDLVIVGECHYVSQYVELLKRLIPRLYGEAGFRFLGYEFFAASCQKEIDSLVNGENYDEELALRIVAESAIRTGYFSPWQEYLDVFKIVWELNRGIPEEQERFRIIFLMPDMDWHLIYHGTDVEKAAALEAVSSADRRYAENVVKGYECTGRKGLIWCGSAHALTRLTRKARGAPEKRMGAYLYERFGSRAFQVMLHSPWVYGSDCGYALDGVLDDVLDAFGKPVGFDVAASPLSKIELRRGFFLVLAEPSRDAVFGDYCDGYVWITPLANFEGVKLRALRDIAVSEQVFRQIVHNAASQEVHGIGSMEEYLAVVEKEAERLMRFAQEFLPFLSRRHGP